jgi:hypothetical protein
MLAADAPSAAGRCGRDCDLRREILVSGLREYLAELNVRVQVTNWQVEDDPATDRDRVPVAGDAGDAIFPVFTPTGLTLLWLGTPDPTPAGTISRRRAASDR